jgi:multidrug efflux pump subunit AcrA (membrane-fusion protein)
LASGSRAQARIVIKTVRSAVVVPNSALAKTSTTTARVTVLAGNKTSTKVVQTGVTGSALTQIVSGLGVGDTIVLANKKTSLPANSSTATTTRVGPGGGAGNGPPAGFVPPAGFAPPGN